MIVNKNSHLRLFYSNILIVLGVSPVLRLTAAAVLLGGITALSSIVSTTGSSFCALLISSPVTLLSDRSTNSKSSKSLELFTVGSPL